MRKSTKVAILPYIPNQKRCIIKIDVIECGFSAMLEKERGKSIMYPINSTVFYGMQGVCKVADIRKETIGSATHEYYILKPLDTSRSTIYVPTDNASLVSQMRASLTAAEIDEMIRAIPQTDALWIENEEERKKTYQSLLKQGDPHSLIAIIKGLYLHRQSQLQKKRKLHLGDQHCFQLAEKLLYEEVAAALHIQPEEVVPYITARIENPQQPA